MLKNSDLEHCHNNCTNDSDLEYCHNNCTDDLVLYHVFGLDYFKGRTIEEPYKILYIVGKVLIKLDLVSKKCTYIYYNKMHVIGCIATSTKLNQLFIDINKSPSIIVRSLVDVTVHTELVYG